MPLTEQARRAYMLQAGVTDKQLAESVGDYPVEDVSAARSALPPQQLTSAAEGVKQLQTDATIISAKYNVIHKRSKRDAREMTAEEELAQDRQLLDELIADEFQLVNPFGKSEGKAETINKILSGTITPDTFGAGGFEAQSTLLKVHGEEKPGTVVLHGKFFMKGSGLAKFTKSGAIRRRDLTGEYRATHTFIFRDGRWQVTATHMTEVPKDPGFKFVGEDD